MVLGAPTMVGKLLSGHVMGGGPWSIYPPGNICHLWKRKVIFPATFQRGYVGSLQGIYQLYYHIFTQGHGLRALEREREREIFTHSSLISHGLSSFLHHFFGGLPALFKNKKIANPPPARRMFRHLTWPLLKCMQELKSIKIIRAVRLLKLKLWQQKLESFPPSKLTWQWERNHHVYIIGDTSSYGCFFPLSCKFSGRCSPEKTQWWMDEIRGKNRSCRSRSYVTNRYIQSFVRLADLEMQDLVEWFSSYVDKEVDEGIMETSMSIHFGILNMWSPNSPRKVFVWALKSAKVTQMCSVPLVLWYPKSNLQCTLRTNIYSRLFCPNVQWFCPYTLGRYAKLPQTPQKKEFRQRS